MLTAHGMRLPFPLPQIDCECSYSFRTHNKTCSKEGGHGDAGVESHTSRGILSQPVLKRKQKRRSRTRTLMRGGVIRQGKNP